VTSKALGWFYRNRLEQSGVAISNLDPTAYNEVSGYWIPTLIRLGHDETAAELGGWLAAVQLAEGSFRDCFGEPNPFDTGQIVRGLHALAIKHDRFKEPLHRACRWMVSQIGPKGVPASPFEKSVPDWVLLYAYEPVTSGSRFLGDEPLAQKARACVEAYASSSHAPKKWNAITHFFGYWLEGLVDAGLAEIAAPHLEKLAQEQARDGSLAAMPGVKWVCTPGLAQVALAWHKTGRMEEARRAMQWLASKQNSSGGWCGSYGHGAKYFQDAEISWASKFVIDLSCRIQPQKHAPQHGPTKRLDAGEWSSALTVENGPAVIAERVRHGKRQPWTDLLLRWTAPGQRVLELGSGTAEMSASLGFHDRRMTLVDLSPANLDFGRELFAQLSLEVDAQVADIEKPLPFGGGEFDVVFSSGVLEHYDDETIARLLREFGRVARLGVISLVPNASSLPYRIGKSVLEARGKWRWGHERPLRSLRPYCEAAGLRVVEETTVGLVHSLNFLRDAGLWQLADQLRSNLPDADCGNGYLVATLARKP
jgi:hypothetical protein